MKRREEKSTSVLGCAAAGIAGGAAAMVILLIATFGLAALMEVGSVKEVAAEKWCLVLLALSTLLGARFAFRRAGGRRLAVSLITAAVVLGLLMLISRLCFHDYECLNVLPVLLAPLAGALAAALLGGGKKRRPVR